MKSKDVVHDRTRCISFPPKRDMHFEAGEIAETIKGFDAICIRENWDFSMGVWMAAKEYVDRHGPGNPAQKLERFMSGESMYRAPKGLCRVHGCPNLAIGYARNKKTNVRMQYCGNHLRDALKAGWMKDE
jgi:hypothetical protein